MIAAKKTLQAMTYEGNKFVKAFLMARASYSHSRAYELTVYESFSGALIIFKEVLL